MTTAEPTTNRVHDGFTEDEIQQITGMETLLNAPLHTSKQRDKVGFDIGGDFGDETVMFCSDDAFMDMTHSQTMNIANNKEIIGDISLQNYDILPTSGEKTMMFTAGDGSMDITQCHTADLSGSVSLPTTRGKDLRVEKSNIYSSVPRLVPDFENFLASLFKPSGPILDPVTLPAGASSEESNYSSAHTETHKADVDKENQPPTSLLAGIERSINTSRKFGESSYGSALCKSMDMTETHTSRIRGFTDDDTPLHSLYPTRDASYHPGNRLSQMAEKTTQQQGSRTQSSSHTTDLISVKNPSLHVPPRRHTVNLDTKDEHREKTILFTASDEFMDMTQSHTVNISSGSVAPANQNCTSVKMNSASSLDERRRETCGPSISSGQDLDPGFKNLLAGIKTSVPSGDPEFVSVVPPSAASPQEAIGTNCYGSSHQTVGKEQQSQNETKVLQGSFHGDTICPESDVSMEMTETQTGRIGGLIDSDGLVQFIHPTQDTNPLKGAEMTSREENSETGLSNRAGLETSLKPFFKANLQKHQVNSEDDCSDKTVRFSAADDCMDMTQTHTVNIATDFAAQDTFSLGSQLKKGGCKDKAMEPAPLAKTDLQRNEVTLISGDDCRDKTIRFTADEACMDVTQSLNVNIVLDKKIRSHQNVDCLPAYREKTVRFTANDAAMDITQCHPVNKVTYFGSQSLHDVGYFPACGEKTVRFTASEACMDMTQSHTVNIDTDSKLHSQQNLGFVPAHGEKTVRFTAVDAAMDMTQCLTANIISDIGLHSRQNMESLPAHGERTVRFTASEACMDMTQSHTVNIDTNSKLHAHRHLDFIPGQGEKTVRFNANEATMDMTQSHTVNIVSDLKHSEQTMGSLPGYGEKTVRFTVNDAAMDMTQSHTVNIASDLKQQSDQAVSSLPVHGEKTVRFDEMDAEMDLTKSQTADIASHFDVNSHPNMDALHLCSEEAVKFSSSDATVDVTESRPADIVRKSVTASGCLRRDSSLSSSHENRNLAFPVKKRASETRHPHRKQSSSAHGLDPGFKISLSKETDTWTDPVITKAALAAPLESVDSSVFLDQPKTQEPDDDAVKDSPGLIPAILENPVTSGRPDDKSKALPEAETVQLLDEAPRCSSSKQSFNFDSDPLDKTDVSQESNAASETSILKDVEVTNQTNRCDSTKADNKEEPEPRNEASSPNAGDHTDTAPSRKSRRASLANLHSKIRRLSHMINTAPDEFVTESCTAPVSQLEHDADKNTDDKTSSLPAPEPEPEMICEDIEVNPAAQCLREREQASAANTQTQGLMGDQPVPATATPFGSKTVQLMSRLSVGGFKPKLPERSKPDASKKVNSEGEHTRTMTMNTSKELGELDGNVSDIFDEELGSCEDMSEMLDVRSPQKPIEEVSPPLECCVDGPLEDNVFEKESISEGHGIKRPWPEDELNVEDEKRMRPSTGTTDFEMGSQSPLLQCDGSISTVPCMTTQSTDDSSGIQTASIRCESTLKQSLFESQLESMLEDYASDVQRKFDDGTVTVLEFFKLFNIDFVIHNPRQSVRPDKLPSDTDLTPMDLLKDRHINHPKQMVYETDVQALAERVEELKVRKKDLNKPLKMVSKTLWEDMRNSSEQELKSFGAKLKQRNNLFRKTGKNQSHEMKEVLYTKLVQANLEEQQKLRGTIEEADEMLRSLDDCIHGLEAELAAVEEKGFEDAPSLKSLQEEMKTVSDTLTDNERQISELELQNEQNSKKLKRLKSETRRLEEHVDTLRLVNEWKFGENEDNCTVYTFLHGTFHLQLIYQESEGNDAEGQSEKKISQITFKHQLDVEKSQDHARLVHKLLAQYVDGVAAWAEKYPTSRYVPKLLHDVGLVVGRCRLLGEELRMLKMWGGLKLDILSISCMDTRVHIIFSSLKTFSKFEVIFSVSLTNFLCVLQMESFKNVIGNATSQQVEEIIASFSPGGNVLTKIIKKIHEKLL
ncbi:kinetochore scaffold 1 [Antennarius striatus]|uniref:kinetochore scaffold 1 n=1 Tax=Antennarius striatus TaxID=241820 RepID=UPI0035B1CA2B